MRVVRIPEGSRRPTLFRHVGRLLVEFGRAHPAAMLSLVLLMGAGSASSGLYFLSLRGFVDSLTGTTTTARSGALFWVGLILAAMVVEMVTNALHPLLDAFLRDHGAHRLQRRVLEEASNAPLIRFEESTFFDALQRAADGVGDRLVDLFSRLVLILRLFLWTVSIGVSLAVVHPWLTPILIAGTVPNLWLRSRAASLLYHVQRRQTGRNRLRSYLQGLLTGRAAAAEIRLFGAARYLLQRWLTLWREKQRDTLATEGQRAKYHGFSDLFSGLAYAAAVALVTLHFLQGRGSVGDFAAVTMGAMTLQSSLATLFGMIAGLREHVEFVGDAFEFFALVRDGRYSLPDDRSLATHVTTGDPRYTVTPDPPSPGYFSVGRGLVIAAENLTFSYPSASRPVLNGITLRIGPSERVAIVGENGAGKTTLVKLLIGLYVPQNGSVWLEDPAGARFPIDAARHRIAAVFQDHATYALTLRENIGFGRVDALADDGALAAAARKAGILDLLDRLPQGWDSYLGKEFGKTDLSGGEWQRIALARAFFREADILVLDEPTATLDPLAELALFERFADLARGKTAIMISHRLGAARLADRILVLAQGRVVEAGSHAELIALGGEYARLFALQAQWYR